MFDIKIVKENENSFTDREFNDISEWLKSVNKPERLRINDVEQYDYFGTFSQVKMDSDKCIVATFTSNTQYGWILKEQRVDVNKMADITVIADTDGLDEYVFPVLEVVTNSISEFMVINHTSSEKLSLMLSTDDIVYLDSDNKTITDRNGTVKSDDLLSLVISPGENRFTIIGDASVVIRWYEPREVMQRMGYTGIDWDDLEDYEDDYEDEF